MQIDTPFSAMGIEPTTGSALMRTLGLTPDDLKDLRVVRDLSDVAKFVSMYSDGEILVSRVVQGRPMAERLSRAHDYIKLRTVKAEIDNKIIEKKDEATQSGFRNSLQSEAELRILQDRSNEIAKDITNLEK